MEQANTRAEKIKFFFVRYRFGGKFYQLHNAITGALEFTSDDDRRVLFIKR